jgi:STE24 endopeptidase
MAQSILWIILAILVFDFLFERILDILNARRFSPELPPELAGIYDAEEYSRSQFYFIENQRFSLLTSTFSFLLMAGMLYFGGFALIDNLVRNVTTHPVLMALLFFGVIGLASDLLSLPFQLYDTFVIEEKYGFNKTTPKTFFFDKMKGWLLGAIIGGGLLALIVWVYESTGSLFWLIAWGVMVLFSAVMMMFYASWILPLFNKLTPLEEGSLRDAIERFAQKVGFKLDSIFVMDGSKRSSKANAFFSGLGSKKKIVMFDTLIRNHTKEELVSVLAHETGHYKKKHTMANFIIATIQTGLMFFLLSFFIDKTSLWPAYLANALGAKEPSFHLGILAFGLLYAPLSLLLGIVTNYISRKNEFAADRYAAVNYAARPLQEALKKMSVNHLSNLQPHPAYVFVHYSHPPLLQRLKALEAASS